MLLIWNNGCSSTCDTLNSSESPQRKWGVLCLVLHTSYSLLKYTTTKRSTSTQQDLVQSLWCNNVKDFIFVLCLQSLQRKKKSQLPHGLSTELSSSKKAKGGKGDEVNIFTWSGTASNCGLTGLETILLLQIRQPAFYREHVWACLLEKGMCSAHQKGKP